MWTERTRKENEQVEQYTTLWVRTAYSGVIAQQKEKQDEVDHVKDAELGWKTIWKSDSHREIAGKRRSLLYLAVPMRLRRGNHCEYQAPYKRNDYKLWMRSQNQGVERVHSVRLDRPTIWEAGCAETGKKRQWPHEMVVPMRLRNPVHCVGT